MGRDSAPGLSSTKFEGVTHRNPSTEVKRPGVRELGGCLQCPS